MRISAEELKRAYTWVGGLLQKRRLHGRKFWDWCSDEPPNVVYWLCVNELGLMGQDSWADVTLRDLEFIEAYLAALLNEGSR